MPSRQIPSQSQQNNARPGFCRLGVDNTSNSNFGVRRSGSGVWLVRVEGESRAASIVAYLSNNAFDHATLLTTYNYSNCSETCFCLSAYLFCGKMQKQVRCSNKKGAYKFETLELCNVWPILRPGPLATRLLIHI